MQRLGIGVARALATRCACDARRFSSSRGAYEKFKILFCGSDAFSVATLQAVLDAEDVWQSIHVLTPGDKRIGRGRMSQKSLDKYRPTLRQFADDHDLPTSVLPETGFTGEWTLPTPFDTLSPSHLLLTASFGHIIPDRILALFADENALNVHPSLLPRYRGAAPIQWTIANGDKETGVSVQRLVQRRRGIDAGHLIGTVEGIEVPGDANYWSLLPKLAEEGGTLLVDVLRRMQAGTATASSQKHWLVTRAPKITHETACIRWEEQNAVTLDRLARGISHQEPLWTTLDESMGHSKVQLLSFTPADPITIPAALTVVSAKPGQAFFAKWDDPKRLLVACAPEIVDHGDGDSISGGSGVKPFEPTWIDVRSLRMEGRKEIPVSEWWNGLPKGKRAEGKIRFIAPKIEDEGPPRRRDASLL